VRGDTEDVVVAVVPDERLEGAARAADEFQVTGPVGRDQFADRIRRRPAGLAVLVAGRADRGAERLRRRRRRQL